MGTTGSWIVGILIFIAVGAWACLAVWEAWKERKEREVEERRQKGQEEAVEG